MILSFTTNNTIFRWQKAMITIFAAAVWGVVGVKICYGTTSSDSELKKIGKLTLDWTNHHRSQSGLPPLQWDDRICHIAKKHARQMAKGDMPFSHQDSDKRYAAMPAHTASSENLAKMSARANLAKDTVQGWINSPAHENNLRC